MLENVRRLFGVGLFVVTAGCASVPSPLSCRDEAITLRVFPAVLLNQDREGFARSVVLRIYQLQDTRDFRASSFDAIWSAPLPRRSDERSNRPEEWIVLPGRSGAHELRRDPAARHLAIAANFREHRGESGWRAIRRLPAPQKECALAALAPPVELDVVLNNYALELR